MVSIQNLEFELQDLFREKKYSDIIFEFLQLSSFKMIKNMDNIYDYAGYSSN